MKICNQKKCKKIIPQKCKKKTPQNTQKKVRRQKRQNEAVGRVGNETKNISFIVPSYIFYVLFVSHARLVLF